MNKPHLLILFSLLFIGCKEDFPSPDTPPLFSFGMISDVQYADIENAGTRYYRLSPAKLKEAVDDFNRETVDFVISLGDFIDENSSFLPTRILLFRQIFKMLD